MQARPSRTATAKASEESQGEIWIPRVHTGRILLVFPVRWRYWHRRYRAWWSSKFQVGRSSIVRFGNALICVSVHVVRGAIGCPYSVVPERRLLPPYDPASGRAGSANAPGIPRRRSEVLRFLSRIANRVEDLDCPVNERWMLLSFQPLDADASVCPVLC